MIRELPIENCHTAPGEHLCGLAWDGQNLWHSDASTDRLYCLNPQTGAILTELPCPEIRTDLAYDGTFLWQIAGRPKRIRVIDPKDGQISTKVY